MILVEYQVMNYTVNEMCSEWTLWFITRDVAHSFAYVTQTLQILTPYFSYSGIDKTADWEEEIEGTVHTRHFPYYSYMNQIRYCILTHCWRIAKVIKLYRQNLPSCEHSVLYRTWKKTFCCMETWTVTLKLFDEIPLFYSGHFVWTLYVNY